MKDISQKFVKEVETKRVDEALDLQGSVHITTDRFNINESEGRVLMVKRYGSSAISLDDGFRINFKRTPGTYDHKIYAMTSSPTEVEAANVRDYLKENGFSAERGNKR